jgi:peptidoglycan/LPS O-acetylase OafA/YrhL
MWIYVSQYLYQPEANILLFQNAPGHLPEFALGILLAMKKDRRIHIVWVLLSFVIFALGNFYKLFFPFTFLSVTVIFYWVFFKFLPVLNKTKKIKKVLTYYGAISMILFVIHGPLRWNFIVISGETFWGKILGAILLLVVATALSILGNMLHEWMVRRLDSTYFKKKPNCK